MKLVKASYQIVQCPSDPLEQIEQAARTCYKSEDRITPGSARRLVQMLIEKGHHACLEFGGLVVVKFVSNRGFSHEMVRHRICSFAQESTRYCGYHKGKFGSEIMCCEPLEPMDQAARETMLESWRASERRYLELTTAGIAPQIARDVLPIGLKTEIVVGANTREWRHIFEQRCSPQAHPRMRELMIPLLRELQICIPVLYDGIEP